MPGPVNSVRDTETTVRRSCPPVTPSVVTEAAAFPPALVTPVTAESRNCGRLWRNAASAMSSRWPVRLKWAPLRAPSAPTPWQRRCRCCLAEALGRTRCEGTAVLRLGCRRSRRPGAAPSPAADRRNRPAGELAYYRCYSPEPVPLTTLVRVAGSRWRVEETLQSEKGLADLDEHQVRRSPSWNPWVTLAMLAHAFLAVVRADEHARCPGPAGLVPLSCNEIRGLLITLVVQPLHDTAHRLGWSDWGRRHQERSRTSHDRRQAAQGA